MVDVSFVLRGRCIKALKYLHSGRKCQGIASSSICNESIATNVSGPHTSRAAFHICLFSCLFAYLD